MMKRLQNLGRSLMLPVAVLPAAAILAGVGNWSNGLAGDNVVGSFLSNAGTSILDNVGMLFAAGIAIGLSKDKHGSAALSGLVGFLVVTTLLSTDTVAELQGIVDESLYGAVVTCDYVLIGVLYCVLLE